jgi:putative SOS response-associated peptidase YedK
MCGRYRLSRRKQIIEEHFHTMPDDDQDWTPHYNIAPTQLVPVIRQNPKEPIRELSIFRWGLIPSWSKDASGAARMINARSETLAVQPGFREAFKERRCLIPADGFYEWQKTRAVKQPYCFEVNNGELFAFAGLWERWKNPAGEWIKSCTIATTTPNTVTGAIHDRMPVILNPESYDLWLDPGMHDTTMLADFLRPFDTQQMRRYPVNPKLNNVKNDNAESAAPITLKLAAQVELF